jgi:hypothetical protein
MQKRPVVPPRVARKLPSGVLEIACLDLALEKGRALADEFLANRRRSPEGNSIRYSFAS